MTDATIGSLTTSDFTIEGAFYISTATLNMYYLGKMDNTVEYAIRLDSVDSNILKFDLFQSDNTDRSLTIVLSLSAAGVTADGTWHWLSIRMDHTGTALLTCEIDGASAISTDVSAWSGTWRQDVFSRFTIGADGKAGTNIWNGGVDEVAIYLKAISDQNRASNFNTWDDGLATVTAATTVVTPSSVAATPSAGAYTTPLLSAVVSNGRGPFTYLWSSDGSNLTPDSPTSSSTTFSGNETNVTTTETLTCTATDLGDSNAQSSDTVTTNIAWGILAATVVVSPASINTTTPSGAYTSAVLSASVTDGVGPFTYLWTSSDGRLTPDTATAATTTFSGSQTGVSLTSVLKCVVTDTGNSSITSEDTSALTLTWLAINHTVTVVPTSLDVLEPSGAYTTPNFVSTVLNGVGPFTYEWSTFNDSPSAALTPDTSTTANSTLSGNETDLDYTGSIRLKVIDTGNANYTVYSNTVSAHVVWSQIYNEKVYYTFDNFTGNIAQDEEVGNHDATFANTPTLSLGYDGNQIEFAGGTGVYGELSNPQRATMVDHADWQPTNFTLSVWITTQSVSYVSRTIFQSYNNTTGVAGITFTNKSGTITMLVGDNTGFTYTFNYQKVSSVSVVHDNTLTHVAASYDGANLKMYINGVLENTAAWAGGVAYHPTDNRVRLGILTASAIDATSTIGIYPFKGDMDDFKFYDSALSDTDIAAIYALVPALQIVVTPEIISDLISPNAYYTTPTITQSVNHGTGPYTYAWVRTSGSTLSIDGSTTATSITASGQGDHAITTDVFECTVTDALGVTASDSCSVTINWDSV